MAAVIASAVVPTMIAGMAFLPSHLLPQVGETEGAEGEGSGLPEEG